MIKKLFYWGLLLGFVVANTLVYQHAAAMTDFAAAGERTERPENLSLWDKVKVLSTGITLVRRPLDKTPADYGLQYSTHRLDNSLGYELHAWHTSVPNAQSTVLLFHGYGGNASLMLEHSKAFNDLGYNTFVLDFFGSGGSSGTHTTVGVAEAQDVKVAVDYVREHWPDQRYWLFGQSMGAAAITRAVAELGVEADALVLESSYDTLLHTAQVRFNSMGLPGSPFAQWLLFWGGVRHGFNPFDMKPAEFAESITTPTLLLQGGIDVRVPNEQAQAIDSALAGWHELAVFEEAGHVGMLKSDPVRWREEVQLLSQQIH
jgi:alpha-beta hydrolase superfamily lysophospholipase